MRATHDSPAGPILVEATFSTAILQGVNQRAERWRREAVAPSRGRFRGDEGPPLLVRADSFELDTEYEPPPGDPLEHHTAGFAKILCSNVFISGLDPEFAAENVGFFSAPAGQRQHVVDTVVDFEDEAVHLTLPDEPLPPEVDPETVAAAVDPAIDPDEAMTAAFVVTWRGRVIGERYRDGIDMHTPLESWSMGKSLTGDLMRMSSGLRFRAPQDPDFDSDVGYPDHLYVYTSTADTCEWVARRGAERDHHPLEGAGRGAAGPPPGPTLRVLEAWVRERYVGVSQIRLRRLHAAPAAPWRAPPHRPVREPPFPLAA